MDLELTDLFQLRRNPELKANRCEMCKHLPLWHFPIELGPKPGVNYAAASKRGACRVKACACRVFVGP